MSYRLYRLWQAAFLLLSTSWLWAPALNRQLSYRTTLISQYEVPGQPYFWVFKAGDIVAALLLLLVIVWYRQRLPKALAISLGVIGLGYLIDPIFSVNCHMVKNACTESVSPSYIVHAVETVATAAVLFGVSVYDLRRRRMVVSACFVAFQVVYAFLLVSQLATSDSFNTLSQYVFQLATNLWLAWYVGELLALKPSAQPRFSMLIRRLTAGWAFASGALAIGASLGHLRLLGQFEDAYFLNGSAWLAQHGVAVGLIMLYLSRHLLRGERRACQLVLVLLGTQVIKYAVITPHPLLLAFYVVSFVFLVVSRAAFDRGLQPLTVIGRLKELTTYLLLTAGVLVASALLLYRNPHISRISNGAFTKFYGYAVADGLPPHAILRSALLAHTLSTLALVLAATVLWILFRPARPLTSSTADDGRQQALSLLERYSQSSEDYFKLWPADKQYFFDGPAFIAYKVVGGIAFSLADPVAASQSKQAAVLAKYTAHCRTHGWQVCFLPVLESKLALYRQAGLREVAIGSSALVEIDTMATQTARDKWWRWQINKSVKSGLDYAASQPPHSQQLLSACRSVSDDWLAKAGRKERGFALGYFNEEYLQECIIHHLSIGGEVVAFTNELPTYNQCQTVTVDLLRYHPNVRGAMSYLIYKIIESKSGGDSRFFDLGFVPFAGVHDTPIKIIKAVSGGRFSASGLEQFKNKFKPQWQKQYLLYQGDLADLALVALNLERAMGVNDLPNNPSNKIATTKIK